MVILGDVVIYEVVDDDDGNAAGAKQYTDRSLIRETNAGFDALCDRGEGFHDFFNREIATLAPPRVSGAPTGSRGSR